MYPRTFCLGQFTQTPSHCCDMIFQVIVGAFVPPVFTCNLHTAILSSSFFLYLELSHHSLRYYYISSKHRMTDAMYIILHTGTCILIRTKKKQRRKILLSCTAFHHLLFSLFSSPYPCSCSFFFSSSFMISCTIFLCHKPILHFRFGLAVLKFVSPDFGRKKIEPRPILVFKE